MSLPLAPSEVEVSTTTPEWTPLVIMESPASPDPTVDANTDDGVQYIPLETFSGTYTPVSSPTLVTTTAVATLPTAAASLGGPRSPTPPTARWSWSTSSEEGDDYRGVVDGVTEAVVHHVKCAMNTCCRSRVKMEIRACFARIMSEAMEPGFLDDIATQILH